jgi:glycerol-3-phosphate acyltransferase PlsY
MDSSAATLVAAAAIGYMIGSISSARLIARLAGTGDLERTTVVLDGTGSSVETHGVSPSALMARLGARAGLISGAIDILKALIPTLVARLAFPDSPEAVLVATAVLVGHVYPVYHRFVGGYGISPLLGGLVVLDWRAPLVAIVLLAVVGIILGSAFVGIESWPLALIPWFSWQGSGWLAAYALVANAIYWWRSRGEAMAAYRSFRRDQRPWRQRVADFKKYPDYEIPEL